MSYTLSIVHSNRSQRIYHVTKQRLFAPVLAMALCCLLFHIPDAASAQTRVRLGAEAAMQAAEGMDPRFEALVQRLASEGYPLKRLTELYSRPEVFFDPDSMGKKMRVLYKTKYKPAEPEPAPEAVEPETPAKERERIPLHAPHLTPEVRERLAVFRAEHAGEFEKIKVKWGVPAEIVLAVLVVETKLGGFLGAGTALNVLSSMAVASGYDDMADFLDVYEPDAARKAWLEQRQSQKAQWAYGQLKALLEYAWANGLDPAVLPGSIYGAIGMCQFMPSNVERLAVDGDGDGVVNVYNPVDAAHSVAKFLHNAGWKEGLSRKQKIKVIKRYNPDYFYAITVLAVAREM